MQSSLWLALGGRLGHLHMSNTNEYGLTVIDEILSRDRYTLEEMLDTEEIIQEAKYGHQGLIEFLSTPATVEQLVRHTIAEPPTAVPVPADSDKRKTTEETEATSIAAAASSSSAAASSCGDDVDAVASASAAAAASSSSSASPTAPASSASTASSILATLSPDVLVSTVPAGSLLTEVIDENCATTDDLPVLIEEGMEEPAAATDAATAAPAADDAAFSSAPSDEVDALHSATSSLSTMSLDDSDAAAHAATSASAPSNDDQGQEHGGEQALQPTYFKNAHKFPYMSSELLCGEIGNIVDVLVEDERLLSLLFSLLQRPPPLDPSCVSYFRKVLQVLIQRKYPELVSFCARQNMLDSLLRHLGLYSILELIIMLGWDSGLMDGSIDQTWMLSQRLIPKLVRRLAPRFKHMQDVHAHAGRLLVDVVVKCPLNATSPLVEHLSTTPILQALCKHLLSGCVSSLSNSLSVIIVLVQRFANRRLEQIESHSQSANSSGDFSSSGGAGGFDHGQGHGGPPPATNEWNQPGDYEMAAAEDGMQEGEESDDTSASDSSTPAFTPSPSTDPDVLALGEPFISLLPHLPKILDILLPEPTGGPAAAAAAASAAAASSASSSATASAPSPPMPISGVLGAPAFGSLRMKVVELCLVLARSRSALIDAQLASLHVSRTMLQVFFAYPWNNLLHGLVESIVTSALEEPESQLTRTLFSEGHLVDAFIEGWKTNAACVARGQMRRGYMGHLIRTAATVDHMLHAMSQTQRDSLLQDAASRWHWFASEILSEELSAQQSEDSLEVLLGGGMGGNGGGMTQSMTQQDLQHAQQQQQPQHHMVPDGYALSYDDHDQEEEEDDHDQDHDQDHEADQQHHHHSNVFHTHSHSHALTSRDDLDEEDGGGVLGIGGGLGSSGGHNESEEWVGAASYFHPHPRDDTSSALGGGSSSDDDSAAAEEDQQLHHDRHRDNAQDAPGESQHSESENGAGQGQGQGLPSLSRFLAHVDPSGSLLERRVLTAREARAVQEFDAGMAADAAARASVPVAADSQTSGSAAAADTVSAPVESSPQ